jgi:hypothetical protein
MSRNNSRGTWRHSLVCSDLALMFGDLGPCHSVPRRSHHISVVCSDQALISGDLGPCHSVPKQRSPDITGMQWPSLDIWWPGTMSLSTKAGHQISSLCSDIALIFGDLGACHSVPSQVTRYQIRSPDITGYHQISSVCSDIALIFGDLLSLVPDSRWTSILGAFYVWNIVWTSLPLIRNKI